MFKWLTRFFGDSDKSPDSVAESASAPASFKTGQVWRYKTRPEDPDSFVVIGKVETVPVPARPQDPLQATIVSVLIGGLKIREYEGSSEVLEEISHVPIELSHLTGSVTELVTRPFTDAANGVPALHDDFKNGYANWKRVFDAGQVGFYKVSLAECVRLAEETFKSQTRPRR